MTDNVRNLISWWKLKGQRETDYFIKFFFFYVCFDAWITSESNKDSDWEKLNWLFTNDSCLKRQWSEVQSSRVISLLKNLQHYSPLEDMRPGHRNRKVYLDDTENFEQVIRFIYQIRCNLFHGAKDPMNNRDAILVELSAEVLEKWIVWAHLKC